MQINGECKIWLQSSYAGYNRNTRFVFKVKNMRTEIVGHIRIFVISQSYVSFIHFDLLFPGYFIMQIVIDFYFLFLMWKITLELIFLI